MEGNHKSDEHEAERGTKGIDNMLVNIELAGRAHQKRQTTGRSQQTAQMSPKKQDNPVQ